MIDSLAQSDVLKVNIGSVFIYICLYVDYFTIYVFKKAIFT